MSEVRLCASHPDFKKFDRMQHLLLMATNPQMFFIEVDVPNAEQLATVEMIKADIAEMLDEYEYLPPNIAEVVNKLEEGLNDN